MARPKNYYRTNITNQQIRDILRRHGPLRVCEVCLHLQHDIPPEVCVRAIQLEGYALSGGADDVHRGLRRVVEKRLDRLACKGDVAKRLRDGAAWYCDRTTSGYTRKEMAAILQLPIDTVRGRINRKKIEPISRLPTREAVYSPDAIVAIHDP